MKTQFQFASTPKIYFGANKLSVLKTEISKRGYYSLIIIGANSFKDSTYYNFLIKDLASEYIIPYIETIATEPSPEIVDAIVDKYRSKRLDVIVAIGGGSVLDGGKAISAMLKLDESVKNYLEGVGSGKAHPGTKVPFIAIPTTSGTGSETTKNAVLSVTGTNGFKKSLRHDNFIPDVAIIDPTLSLNCPPQLTANCGMDAFTQLLESYVSTEASPLTDSFAYEGLKAISRSIETAVSGSGNDKELLAARSDMALAAMLSGITLANAGLGIIHGLAGVIGAYHNIPHGVVCGTLMGSANRMTIEKLKATDKDSLSLIKYAAIGKLFTHCKNENTEFYCNVLVEKIEELTERFNIHRLSAYNINEADLTKIVKEASNKFNPAKLTEDEILELLKNRL